MYELESSHSRHTPEPDLVPIMDALTCVIFFLLLSTTFIELTKVTLPPSKTSVITNPAIPIPVAAKMMVSAKADKLRIVLRWGGAQPDVIEKQVSRTENNARSAELETEIGKIIQDFTEKFPEEKAIQLGMGNGTTYQEMITTMDGIRTKMQDIVLFSNLEVDAMLRN